MDEVACPLQSDVVDDRAAGRNAIEGVRTVTDHQKPATVCAIPLSRAATELTHIHIHRHAPQHITGLQATGSLGALKLATGNPQDPPGQPDFLRFERPTHAPLLLEPD
ncbi:MAG: hypothetical protein DRJ42_13810 [Deltaproteobacteria bacterium]|nr:MAG: hypothetical protein DRJ42_13810 [Deltaproteobacteria bacterium]